MTDISTLMVPSNKHTRRADVYLGRQHNRLAPYKSLEHFVTSGEDDLDEADFKALMYHLLSLRSALAKLFWKNEVFIGRSVLDEFIFQHAKAGKSPILNAVLQNFTTTAAGQPGFVIYPLHEFGFELPRLFDRKSNLKSHYTFKDFGIALSAQTHSVEKSHERLNDMAKRLGVKNKIDFIDVRHHYLAGHLKWLEKNPLMMVRLSSHTGEYYENQFVYTLKIRLAATLIMMLAALIKDGRSIKSENTATSAVVNNWETLDIRHYLIGEARLSENDPIEFRRIPMNLNALELAQLSDVPVTLNTTTLAVASVRKDKKNLETAMKYVQQAYLEHVNLSSGMALRKRVYLRISKSLDWYRRSFGSRHSTHERVVALAVAFETLLTDSFAKGTDSRLERRVGICLKGKQGISSAKKAVVKIVHHRNEILHTGSTSQEADIEKAQAVFARCFIDLVTRLPNLPTKSEKPISDILGD